MKGRPILYAAEELAWIAARREWPRAALHAAFVVQFDRPDVALGALNALCKRKGWMTGRTGCFETGAAPPNKGKRCPEGVGGRHPNARKTQFQKGRRSGVAVKLYKPIGTERVSKDGYLERKINDAVPASHRWRAVHLIRWEAMNGPVPAGHALKALDGDRANTDPANWELIPRALLPALNGGRHSRRLPYDAAAPELKPALLTMAKIEDRARKLRRGRARPIRHDARDGASRET